MMKRIEMLVLVARAHGVSDPTRELDDVGFDFPVGVERVWMGDDEVFFVDR